MRSRTAATTCALEAPSRAVPCRATAAAAAAAAACASVAGTRSGKPSPGADVAGVSPSPGADVAAEHSHGPVPTAGERRFTPHKQGRQPRPTAARTSSARSVRSERRSFCFRSASCRERGRCMACVPVGAWSHVVRSPKKHGARSIPSHAANASSHAGVGRDVREARRRVEGTRAGRGRALRCTPLRLARCSRVAPRAHSGRR